MNNPVKYDPSYDWEGEPELRRPPRVYSRSEVEELENNGNLANPHDDAPIGYTGPPTSISSLGTRSFKGVVYHTPPRNHPSYPKRWSCIATPEPASNSETPSPLNDDLQSDTSSDSIGASNSDNGVEQEPPHVDDMDVDEPEFALDDETEQIAQLLQESEIRSSATRFGEEACADESEDDVADAPPAAASGPTGARKLPDFSTITLDEIENMRRLHNLVIFEKTREALDSLEPRPSPSVLLQMKTRLLALIKWHEEKCPACTVEEAKHVFNVERKNDAEFIELAKKQFPLDRGIVSVSPGIPISRHKCLLSYLPIYAKLFHFDDVIGPGIPSPIEELDSCHAPSWSSAAAHVLDPVWHGLIHAPSLLARAEMNLGYQPVDLMRPPLTITDVAKYSDLTKSFTSRFGNTIENAIPSQAAVNWSYRTQMDLESKSPALSTFYFQRTVCGRWGRTMKEKFPLGTVIVDIKDVLERDLKQAFDLAISRMPESDRQDVVRYKPEFLEGYQHVIAISETSAFVSSEMEHPCGPMARGSSGAPWSMLALHIGRSIFQVGIVPNLDGLLGIDGQFSAGKSHYFTILSEFITKLERRSSELLVQIGRTTNNEDDVARLWKQFELFTKELGVSKEKANKIFRLEGHGARHTGYPSCGKHRTHPQAALDTSPQSSALTPSSGSSLPLKSQPISHVEAQQALAIVKSNSRFMSSASKSTTAFLQQMCVFVDERLSGIPTEIDSGKSFCCLFLMLHCGP
ncbi:hypothetical protein HDU93_004661 [Gonapodya sp. JEL0774]|nr:hypothetical protein HDU93_004661 [Gonapodya sp. JEL0774]